MAGGASSPRRRTDPGEHSDPFELVDRAREGELDESTRRRLAMVLKSHRDAALELAWMGLFDDVRAHVDEETTQVRPPDPVVERLVRALGPMDVNGPADVTRRVCRIELVDEDARTQRLAAVPDLPELPLAKSPRAKSPRGNSPKIPKIPVPQITVAEVPEIPVPRVAIEWDDTTVREEDEWEDTTIARERGERFEDSPTPRVVVVGADLVAKLRASRRVRPNAPRLESRMEREVTRPWTVERAPRRDDTPIGTTLHAPRSAGRSVGRSWGALVLTAVLSIAAGWVAHGLWSASSDAPPTLASPPATSE